MRVVSVGEREGSKCAARRCGRIGGSFYRFGCDYPTSTLVIRYKTTDFASKAIILACPTLRFLVFSGFEQFSDSQPTRVL